MGTDNTALVMDALDEAAARSERMPFCADHEAMDLQRNGNTTRILDLLIRAGIHESIAMLDLEAKWHRRPGTGRAG